MYTQVMIDKIQYVRGLLAQNKELRYSDVNEEVKKKFGTGIDGNIVKKLIQEVRPDYKGKHFRRVVDSASADSVFDSKRKVSVPKLYKALGELGISPNVTRAAILMARGKNPFVPDFTADQMSKAKNLMSKHGFACFRLSSRGLVSLVKPENVTIADGRQKEK